MVAARARARRRGRSATRRNYEQREQQRTASRGQRDGVERDRTTRATAAAVAAGRYLSVDNSSALIHDHARVTQLRKHCVTRVRERPLHPDDSRAVGFAAPAGGSEKRNVVPASARAAELDLFADTRNFRLHDTGAV